MTEQQYEKLNEYLNGIFIKLGEEDKIFRNNLIGFCYLSDKIVESFSDKIEYEHKTNNLTFEDVFLLVREIIENVNKDYLSIYDTMIKDGVLNFNYEGTEGNSQYNYINHQPLIDIDRQFGYMDVVILIHEFFHYTNGIGQKSFNAVFLTEFISIYFEQYAIRYLYKEKNITTGEINSNARIIDFLRTNNNFNSFCLVFLAFDKLGNIGKNTSKDMEELLQIKDMSFEKECLLFLEKSESLEKQTFSNENLYRKISEQLCHYRYIIGTLLAFYALEECKMEDIVKLNNKINSEEYAYADVFELLKTIGITVDDHFINKSIDYVKQSITTNKVMK